MSGLRVYTLISLLLSVFFVFVFFLFVCGSLV